LLQAYLYLALAASGKLLIRQCHPRDVAWQAIAIIKRFNQPIKNTMKSFLTAAFLATSLMASSAFAAYPDKPIRVVIGFPAGGPLDQHVRLLSDRLQAVLGQPIIIDYKSGAGGTVGAQDVMKAPADGYTLMLANTG
jgi:tripartite-type tricarboxylate transporter receptor subunit TctC